MATKLLVCLTTALWRGEAVRYHPIRRRTAQTRDPGLLTTPAHPRGDGTGPTPYHTFHPQSSTITPLTPSAMADSLRQNPDWDPAAGGATALVTAGKEEVVRPPPRKRRRIVLSCTECHRRKQKVGLAFGSGAWGGVW